MFINNIINREKQYLSIIIKESNSHLPHLYTYMCRNVFTELCIFFNMSFFHHIKTCSKFNLVRFTDLSFVIPLVQNFVPDEKNKTFPIGVYIPSKQRIASRTLCRPFADFSLTIAHSTYRV